jgi:hypothetical protein
VPAMPKLARLSLLVTLTLPLPLVLVGCGKKDAEKAEEKVEVLPEASNGSPVSAKLVKFVGEGEGRGLEIKLYNHGDKTAAGMFFLFRYYDANDKLLKVKPGTPFEKDSDFTSVSGRTYMVKPKKNKTFELEGAMLAVPAEATRVEILPSKVRALAEDGNTIEDWWSQDNFADWPEEG